MSMTFKVGQEPLIDIKQVAGYRISAVFRPEGGLQNNFYVYVVEHHTVEHELTKVSWGKAQAPARGKLTIQGAQRSYELEEMLLLTVQTIVNQGERIRLIEFYCDSTVSDTPPGIAYDVSDDSQRPFGGSRLYDSYKFSIEDGSKKDNLIAFGSFESKDSKVIQFTSRPNGTNSWLQKVLSLSKSYAMDKTNVMKPFKMSFTQITDSGKLSIDPETLTSLSIFHSAGYMLNFPIPSLETIAMRALSTPNMRINLESRRTEVDAMPDMAQDPDLPKFPIGDVRETAVLAFSSTADITLGAV